MFDDVSLGLAHLFLRAYAEHAGLCAWLSERPEFVRWIYRVTILNRLLHNWHVTSRTRLLRLVDEAHRGWLFEDLEGRACGSVEPGGASSMSIV